MMDWQKDWHPWIHEGSVTKNAKQNDQFAVSLFEIKVIYIYFFVIGQLDNTSNYKTFGLFFLASSEV